MASPNHRIRQREGRLRFLSRRKIRVAKYKSLILTASLLLAAPTLSVGAQETTPARQSIAPISILSSTKENDGLLGPVRRVRTETAKITNNSGKPVEEPRALLEATTYDIKGNRVDNAYYPAVVNSDAPAGREEYKRDDKGNLIETIRRDNDGSILSTERYTYEFDEAGNWIKMVTSIAVFEAGKVTFEPIEVTYRTITYYYNQTAAAKIADHSSSPTVNAATTNAAPDAARFTGKSETKGATQPSAAGTVALESRAAEKIEPAQPSILPILSKDKTTGSNNDVISSGATRSKLPPLMVAGAVQKPGNLDLFTPLGLRESLMITGGTTERAGRILYVVRSSGSSSSPCAGQPSCPDSNLIESYERKAAEEGRIHLTRPLQGGDLVYVPEASVAFVAGAIERPDVIALQGDLTVLKAVQSLGGTLAGAQRERVRLLRLLPDGASSQEFIINLTEIEEGRAGDVILQPGDVVVVPSIQGDDKTQSLGALLKRLALRAQPITTIGTSSPVDVTERP
jgi:hypothetical protein